MTCDEVRQNWMLYVDSEGDPELHLRISDHVSACPDCAEWLTRQQRCEEAITERLGEPEDPRLWERVLTRAGVTQPVRSRRPLILGGILVAALVLLAVIVGWPRPPKPPAVELARLTTDCHERHLRGVSQVEFRSQDDHAIDRYIRRQVPFPVRCPPGKDAGFVVEGTGVCRWTPQPMVYFVGRVEETSVSVFVLDRATLDVFTRDRDRLAQGGGRCRARQAGYQTVSCVTAENVVVVVGTALPEVLEKILNAYGGPPAG